MLILFPCLLHSNEGMKKDGAGRGNWGKETDTECAGRIGTCSLSSLGVGRCSCGRLGIASELGPLTLAFPAHPCRADIKEPVEGENGDANAGENAENGTAEAPAPEPDNVRPAPAFASLHCRQHLGTCGRAVLPSPPRGEGCRKGTDATSARAFAGEDPRGVRARARREEEGSRPEQQRHRCSQGEVVCRRLVPLGC